MRCIPHRGSYNQTLELWWQEIKHGLARDERRGTEGDLQFVPCSVIVSDGLIVAFRYLYSIKRSHARGVIFV